MSGSTPDFRTRQVVLRVDFDLLDDDGCAWISMRFQKGLGAPEPGDLVYLLDGRGRGCVGKVEEVDGWYVRVRPDTHAPASGSPPSAMQS